MTKLEELAVAAHHLVADMGCGLSGECVFDEDSWQASLDNAEKIRDAMPLIEVLNDIVELFVGVEDDWWNEHEGMQALLATWKDLK